MKHVLVALPLVVMLLTPVLVMAAKDSFKAKKQRRKHPVPDMTAEQLYEAFRSSSFVAEQESSTAVHPEATLEWEVA
jgi:hypothetical protein